MNKPATKEPSMDEILSSIRQIIADDDAAAGPPPKPPQAAMPQVPAGPLALSPTQIVSRPAASLPPLPDPVEEMMEMPTGEPELVDPEDLTFEPEPEPEREFEPEPPPPPVMRTATMPPPAPRQAPRTVAQAAPMPDPNLSRDMAEELLAPTTDAAVTSTMARLNAVSAIGGGGQTIESMMRELMRPMLKEWLDENLPALVERVVEKEIARISRGVK